MTIESSKWLQSKNSLNYLKLILFDEKLIFIVPRSTVLSQTIRQKCPKHFEKYDGS